jgi:putative ABC transport system permease protein
MYENSPDETKTQTEKDFNVGFIKQIGDIGMIVRWILFAVFFTLLLVVGNTMAQSVRERVPELAVLKTLGFSDGTVLGFVLAEAGALCLFGGPGGMTLATALGALISKGTAGQFDIDVSGWVWMTAGIAVVDEPGRGPAAGAARAPPEDRRRAGRALSSEPRHAEPDRAITGLNLKSIPSAGPRSVIVVGLAGVVAVFCALLAMAAGFEKTLAPPAAPTTAIVLRGGSDRAQLRPRPRRDAGQERPGVRKGADGKPLASAEMIVIAELVAPGRASNNGANITVRASSRRPSRCGPQLKIVEGRSVPARPARADRRARRHPPVPGRGARQTVRMRGSDWTVVAIFESGDAHESELWAGRGVAQTTFNRRGYSSVLLGLEEPAAIATVRDDALTTDPRLTVDVEDEQAYFSNQTKNFRQTIGVLAGIVTVVMALGAIFAALNTMYAAGRRRAARRSPRCARWGFGGPPVVLSVLVESLVLALVGGVAGAAIAWVLFNNYSVSTLGDNFTQVVFAFRVTPQLVAKGLVISLVIGAARRPAAAMRARGLPITTALRAG